MRSSSSLHAYPNAGASERPPRPRGLIVALGLGLLLALLLASQAE